MERLKLIGVLMAGVAMVVLLGSGVHAQYDHDDCGVCHYSGKEESEECQNCSNLKHVRCDIEIPDSELMTVVVFEGPDSYADGGSGICEVCHTRTLCYTNAGDGGSHSDNPDCVSCHPHGQPGGSFSAEASYGSESHETHIRGDKGPKIGACTDCHDGDNFSLFADGNSFASTTVCDNCHSPGGAFDGVVMAKAAWEEGVYEGNGLSLRLGKERWCATCHDDVPANSKQDGTGISAPNKTGDNATFGYYVTGHGATVAYNATIHGQNGPGYACTVCHDASSIHISGYLEDSVRIKEVADDGLDYTLDVSEVCLDCHEVGQDSQNGTLGYDATAEASVHSGGVSGKYNTQSEAETAFRAYGDEADYELDPGYQCEDCHEVHGTQKLAMVLSEIDGYLSGNSYPVGVGGLEVTDTDLTDLDPSVASDDGVCDVCHTDGGTPHPDTNHGGNHHQGETGDSCMDCHTHGATFFHCSDTGAGDGFCHATQQSHATHTDSDNLKGPDIACGTCHDTNDYGYFADGASGDTALADTTVCDNCHSSTGVSMAKANWETGVYDNQYEHLPHWQEDAYYETGDIVLYGTPALVYVAKSTFTSPLGDPLPENWDQILDWQPNTAYETGDLAMGSEKAWRAVSDFISGPATPNGANWELVQRTGTGNDILLAGKEHWCATCHDDQPANSKADLTGVNAPEVLGDDSTYGFYVSGHGRPGIDQECLDCHNSTFVHIDHEHRTYEIEKSHSVYKVIHAYKDSYRLKEDMRIPLGYPDDTPENAFNLCLKACHEPHAGVLSHIAYCETSFRGSYGNDDLYQYHKYHLEQYIHLAYWDSDWSGSPGDWDRVVHQDSAMSCPACHNVHGSPMMVNGTLKANPAMTRHGELISSYDTQDKVPAIDIRWEKLLPAPDGWTGTNVREESDRGHLNTAGGNLEGTHICETCHIGGYYARNPGCDPGIVDTYYAPVTIWTSDFEDNNKDLFYPGEGVRYHLSFHLTGVPDGTEYCVQSQNSGAENTSGGTPWDTPIVIDILLPRGQHEMQWDETIPLEAELNGPGTAQFIMSFTMKDSACDVVHDTVTDKTHAFSIQLQDPNDPPLQPTLTPQPDIESNSPLNVTLEWSQVICPDGHPIEYYVQVDNTEDFSSPEHDSDEEQNNSDTTFNVDLDTGTTWYWRVQARDVFPGHESNVSDWSYADSFDVYEPLLPPTLTDKTDTNEPIPASITLDWGPVSCPDGHGVEYYAEIGDASDFSGNNYNSGWQTDVTWTVSLPTATTWHWRVKARDADEAHNDRESSWSTTDSFLIRGTPGTPILQAVPDIESKSTEPVSGDLQWSTVTCPDGDDVEYYAQMDVSPDFDSDPESHPDWYLDWQSGTSWPVTVAPNTTWYWRVQARDAVHTDLVSSWSQVGSFSIKPYLIDESFEADGYDEVGWVETVTQCTPPLVCVDEDAPIQGTPPHDFGSQRLKALTETNSYGRGYDARSDLIINTEQGETYTSFWVAIDHLDLNESEYTAIAGLFDGNGDPVLELGVYALGTAVRKFRLKGWADSDFISFNTLYHIQIKWDYPSDSWECKIDGVPMGGGFGIISLDFPGLPPTGIKQWRLGFYDNGLYFTNDDVAGTIYFDKLTVSTVAFDVDMPTIVEEPDTTDPAPASVTLEWDPVTIPNGDPVEYTVQVDDASDFSSLDYESAWQTDTSYEVSDLGLGTWYWRVKARDGLYTAWESYWSADSFAVTRPPSTPTANPLADISLPVPVLVTMDGFSATDPDGDPVEFFIEVDTWANNFPGLASPYESGWISATSWQVSLDAARTWFWRITARDANHPVAQTQSTWSTFVIYGPPSAPTLTAHANVASDAPVEVTLVWDAVTCPDGDAPEYYGELWDASDLTDPVYVSGWQSQASWTRMVDHDVDWLWRVQARDSVHTDLVSAWSANGSFDVYLPIDSPTLTEETNSSDPVPVSVTLEWSAVTCPSGNPVEYYVEVDDASDFTSVDFNSGWQSGTNWEVSLPNATTWHWRVQVRDSVETDWFSSWSDSSSFDIFGPPSAPTLTPEPDTSDPVPASVTLEWNAVTCPDGDDPEYYVEVDDSAGFGSIHESSGWQSGTSWSVILPTAITWHWRVQARDSVHTDLISSWSAKDAFDIQPANGSPPSPTVIAAQDMCGLTPLDTPLAWNAVTDPEGDPVEYYVAMDDASDFSSPDFASGWISSTQWSATDVTAGTWHWYVKARDAAHIEGESAWSDPDSFEVISNTLVIEESFEGTGYELTWTESIGSNCIVDEDHTPIPDNPPPGLGSQYLRTYTAFSGDYNAAATYDHGTALSTTFTSFYVNVYFPFPAMFVDGEQKHVSLFKDSANAYVGGLSLYMDGTQLQLRVLLYNDGAWMITESHNIEGETWYKIDIKYDDMGNTWEWRVDDTVVDSGSLVGDHRTGIRYWTLGPWDNDQQEYVQVRYDLLTVGTQCFNAMP